MQVWQKGIIVAALACSLALIGNTAQAQQYPAKPVKIVIGFAAGGPTDVIARLLAQHMTTSMGQSVLVENKTGANGLIATEEVALTKPDGYTLHFSSVGFNANQILMPNRVKYDPIKSFTPITLVATLPMVIVTSYDSPLKTLRDVIAQSKAKPGTISFSSAGNGSSPHLAGELLKSKTGTDMMHVPFRGSGPALMEVMAGRISYMFYPSVGAAEYVAGKRLKVLAIASKQHNPDFPGVPTTDEVGLPGLERTASWVGLLAPAGTPEAVIQRLANEVNKVIALPEAKERLRSLGAVAVGGTPAAFGAFLKSDYEYQAAVIKAASVKGE